MKPMTVTSWQWHEHGDPDDPHTGMNWPKEYTEANDPLLVCPQCGNKWHRVYFEHGVCFDCWGTFWIDWTLPDIEF